MNANTPLKKVGETDRPGFWADGRLYFNRRSERRFFFILTALMLLIGLGFKVGLF